MMTITRWVPCDWCGKGVFFEGSSIIGSTWSGIFDASIISKHNRRNISCTLFQKKTLSSKWFIQIIFPSCSHHFPKKSVHKAFGFSEVLCHWPNRSLLSYWRDKRCPWRISMCLGLEFWNMMFYIWCAFRVHISRKSLGIVAMIWGLQFRGALVDDATLRFVLTNPFGIVILWSFGVWRGHHSFLRKEKQCNGNSSMLRYIDLRSHYTTLPLPSSIARDLNLLHNCAHRPMLHTTPNHCRGHMTCTQPCWLYKTCEVEVGWCQRLFPRSTTPWMDFADIFKVLLTRRFPPIRPIILKGYRMFKQKDAWIFGFRSRCCKTIPCTCTLLYCLMTLFLTELR